MEDELIEKMAEAMRGEIDWLIQQDENAEGLNAADSSRDMARAALGALKAAGWEVVKLPEVDGVDFRHYGDPEVRHKFVHVNSQGAHRVYPVADIPERIDLAARELARAFAARDFAAARVIDRPERNEP